MQTQVQEVLEEHRGDFQQKGSQELLEVQDLVVRMTFRYFYNLGVLDV